MYRIIAIVLLVVGIVLIIYGVNAAESFASDVSRFFTGTPTDRAVWLLIAGLVATVLGITGLLQSPRSRAD